MYKIILNDEVDHDIKTVIEELRKEHIEEVEGIAELYDSLYINGSCTSCNKSRIYYVAYTLATKNIDFIIK